MSVARRSIPVNPFLKKCRDKYNDPIIIVAFNQADRQDALLEMSAEYLNI